MTSFYIIAALLTLAAVAWLLVPLLRARSAAQPQRDVANLAIFKDQLAELDADVRAGTLSPDQYGQAKIDLERRVLEEIESGKAVEPDRSKPALARVTAIVLGLAVPVGAVLLYAQIGNPGAMVQHAEQSQEFTPQQIEQMVAQLAERMQSKPDDPRGWAILARSYYVMQHYQEAADAYEQLLKRIPPDADVLADYADAMAMAQGRSLAGKPLDALQQALKLDPDHWKSLALVGTEAFERKDYRMALRHWEKLLALAPPDSEVGQQIAASVAQARELAGIKTPVVSAVPIANASLSGMVRLAPAIAAKADPSDTVFVYARATEGPKMPLAIMRLQVKDLPAEFKLDDTQAMTPAARLSQHKRVTLVARVSKSGNATTQSGDLIAGGRDVYVGSRDVALLIDTQVP
ncbi:MAG TPA: c-type cytochrome biogenesis protein CcmI [Burkholderiales bacterium]